MSVEPRALSAIVAELKGAVGEFRDDVIAATVCEQEDWRQASFVDAMRDYRHVTNLVGELEKLATAAPTGGAP